MARLRATVRDRLDAFRRAVRRGGARSALVTHPTDIRYLSGFAGDDSWLFVTPSAATLVTDFRYAEQAERECPGVGLIVRPGPIAEALAAEVRRRGLTALAFDSERVSVAERERLGAALAGVELVPLASPTRALRMHKDATERRAVVRAIEVAETAFAAFRKAIRQGMTERRLAAELDGRLRLAGAEAPAFPTICAIDASAAMPHARPGEARLKRGSVLLVDFGARVEGYVSDLTRCLVAGRIPAHVREVYRAVLEAQAAGIARAGPGVSLRDVDAAARRVIEDAGFGDAFGHGLGHGIGLDVHEPPAVSPRSAAEAVLEPGMVVTVEPGVYLRGRFGIRIEDDVLVTRRGCRVLSSLAKDLEAMVL